MSFASALDALHQLGQELAPSPTAPRRKFDLAHMRTLAAALGDPQDRFPSVLIAGTNGKGSTTATLASILTAAGYRTGLYTSPHLTRVTERIRTSSDPVSANDSRAERVQNGTKCLTEIPEATFARLYFQVDDAANRLVSAGQLPHHPSYFETLTALAFLYFAEQRVDIAVLEVGLGGRLDATNIVSPLLSVITDIALDHQDYLGNTIAEIAKEKAGILRAEGTLITLPQHPEANQAIGEAAIALNVRAISATPYLPPTTRVPHDQREPGERLSWGHSLPSQLSSPLAPNHYDLSVNGETLHVRSPLAGHHQQRNIALAIAAALELHNLAPDAWRLAPLPALELGIAATHWPGRLEFLPPNLLLDVAHNPAGAWALRAAISTLPDDQPRTLIFSCLKDKDLTEISRILFPLFDASTAPTTNNQQPTTRNLQPAACNLILTPIDSPRATSLSSLLAAAAALDVAAYAAASPAEALALARRLTPATGLILATGSVYLIGALREAAMHHQEPSS